MDMGTEPTTLKSQSSDLLKGKLQPFEVKKSRSNNGKAKKTRSDHLSIAEYQQLVVHLHKTIEKTEQQRLALEEENQQLAKRCRIQRKLVTYLRRVVTTNANQLAECKGQLAMTQSRPISQMRTQRVMSLNSALQKISGVETIEESAQCLESLAAIDPEDLQSVDEAEEAGGWQQMPQSMLNATVAGCKSGLSIAEKAGEKIVFGLKGNPCKSLTVPGSGWYQQAQSFVQSRIKAL